MERDCRLFRADADALNASSITAFLEGDIASSGGMSSVAVIGVAPGVTFGVCSKCGVVNCGVVNFGVLLGVTLGVVIS